MSTDSTGIAVPDNVQYPRRAAGVAGGPPASRSGHRRATPERRRKGYRPTRDAAPAELTDQWFDTLLRELDEAAARLKTPA